jgi:hypothetical protein
MALFPTTPVPKTPYTTIDTFFTITSGRFESGNENVRAARVYPIFSAKLSYQMQDWGQFPTLYQFFISMKGRAGTFTFKDFLGWDRSPLGISWPKIVARVETTTTSNQIFDVPMFSSTSYSLWDNGSQVVEDLVNDPPTAGKFKFYSGGGTDGRDRVKVNTTTGHIYEWLAMGQRAVNARFVADAMSWDSFYNYLTQTGLQIEEAR